MSRVFVIGQRYIADCRTTRVGFGLGVARRRGPGPRLRCPGAAPRPLPRRRARHRLARSEARPGRRDRGREGPGGRGGHHRLVRGDRGGRARPDDGDAGGPARPASHVPARTGLPARGGAGGARAAGPRRTRPTTTYGVRVGRRTRRQGTRRAGQPHPRRGPARRRARGEGLGRRPARRGRGRGVPRRRRPPRRAHCAAFDPARSGESACWSTTWCPGPRRAGSPRPSRAVPSAGHVLVVGHPFVDVWQGVRPAALGIDAWPSVPRDVEWKHGVCQALGWPHRDQADIARAWRRILARRRLLHRPRAEPARSGRGAHRLRHHR